MTVRDRCCCLPTPRQQGPLLLPLRSSGSSVAFATRKCAAVAANSFLQIQHDAVHDRKENKYSHRVILLCRVKGEERRQKKAHESNENKESSGTFLTDLNTNKITSATLVATRQSD